MTAKEQVIKNAYISAGVDWEQVKEYVDNNGWLDISPSNFSNELFTTLKPFLRGCNTKGALEYSPKSLSGIENNNGWITIESEKDLPPDGHYWTINKNGEINASPKLVDETCNDNQYWLSTFTHYQPILKPKPPIY